MSAGRPSFALGPPGSRSATRRRGISKARSISPAAGTPSGGWTATATGSSPTARIGLWIDLNDDGRWDSSSEQFLFGSILTIGDARYAVRSDPFGQRLSVEPLKGSGTVRLALARRQELPAAVEVTATLIGRDGSAVGLTGERAEATVPIGEYRLGTVTCAFDDIQGGPRWNFVFSDIGRRGAARWYKVEQGGTATIDPIGVLEFKTGTEGMGPVRPGDELKVQPQLFTGDGLLIVTCYRGMLASPAGDSGTGAAITLASRGRPHARHRALRLRLRHILLGLRASAIVSTSPDRFRCPSGSTPAHWPACSGLIQSLKSRAGDHRIYRFFLRAWLQRFTHELHRLQHRRRNINPKRQRGMRRFHLAALFDVALFSPAPKMGIYKSAQGIALGGNPPITQVLAL